MIASISSMEWPEAKAPTPESAQPADAGMTGGMLPGMLPGMQQAIGQLFDVQSGGQRTKMEAGNAHSVYEVMPGKETIDTTGNPLKPGDIITANGQRYNVKGVSREGKIVTEDGKLINPADATRVAKQGNLLYYEAETAGATQDNADDARKLWKEMGVKSPYFKNYFGDWEAVVESALTRGGTNERPYPNNGLRAHSDKGNSQSGYGGIDQQAGIGNIYGAGGSSDISPEGTGVRSGSEGSRKDIPVIRGVGILNEKRAPAILYHGTRDIIEAFDLNHPNRKDNGWLGRGVYLTDDPEAANTYATYLKKGDAYPNIMPVYAAVKNPYIADISVKTLLKDASQEYIDNYTNSLKMKGYDGVVLIYPNNVREIVAFDPAQIKSAFNRGTFNPSDARVLFYEDIPQGK